MLTRYEVARVSAPSHSQRLPVTRTPLALGRAASANVHNRIESRDVGDRAGHTAKLFTACQVDP